MWFWIIVAAVCLFFSFLCICGVIISIRAKKNKGNEVKAEETPTEHYLRISSARNEIIEQITKKQSPLTDKLSDINNKTASIQTQTHEMLMKYISTLDRENIDSDFAKLLSIYDRRHNSVNDEYLTALQKCGEKNLSETKELCVLENERKRLNEEFGCVMAEADEWSDVANLKARDSWNNPECEQFYNKLLELTQDEIYKEIKEKSAKWEDYSSRHILTKNLTGFYSLGRNGDKIAIWDGDYNGQVISIDDVMYFQVSEKTTTNTYTSSSGKPTKLGTAINEAIWGTAAATASAVQKSQQNTTTYTKTEKKAMIYFKYELSIEPLEVFSDSEVNNLIAMMPEKQK